MTFVELTMWNTDQKVSFNIDAIGLVREGPVEGTVVYVSGGEGGSVVVNEDYEDVIKAIHKADGDIE